MADPIHSPSPEAAPPVGDRRKRVLAPGGLYLDYKHLAGAGAALGLVWKLWAPFSAAAVFPDTVARIAANQEKQTAVLDNLVARVGANERDVAEVKTYGPRLTTVEQTVAALSALKDERGRALDNHEARLQALEAKR